MIKVFCDVCGRELTPQEIRYCNEMIGTGHYCVRHMPEQNNTVYTYTNETPNPYDINAMNKYLGLDKKRKDIK